MNKAFVNNEAFKIKEIKDIVKNTQKHLVDVHLMVTNPEKYIKGLRKIANYFSIHFEAVKKEKIKKILQKHQNVNIGIAIKPETS